MKILVFLFLFIILTSCSNNNSVYWCGDHACINKAEQEEYFKKTMIVEVRELKETKPKKKSESEIITQQAKMQDSNVENVDELANRRKFEEKKKIYEKKQLAKEAKINEKEKLIEKNKTEEEKLIIKEIEEEEKIIEKNLSEKEKIIKKKVIEEKKIIKKEIIEEEKMTKNDIALDNNIGSSQGEVNKFDKAAENIIKRNIFRPYPDINDIPI